MTMKAKLMRIAMMFMAAVMALSLNSCNEDDDIALTLDGIWEGEVAMDYFSHRWGVQTEYQAVDIQFYADPYRYAQGEGIEYDYLPNGYYTECHFYFEVRNGRIYIDYDDGTSVAIRNYRLTGNSFTGEFIDYYTGDYLASFDFIKVTNWRHIRYTRSGDTEFKKVPSPALQNGGKAEQPVSRRI